jgi:hypothetical protein|tara:strand:+ start:323 stop:544 length:222 start_codon:yes stop_codon:yes gene_type:complete
MKSGDLVKMKSPDSQYQWRQGASPGLGLVIEESHRTKMTMRGCTIMWTEQPDAPPWDNERIQDIPEEWLEVIS